MSRTTAQIVGANINIIHGWCIKYESAVCSIKLLFTSDCCGVVEINFEHRTIRFIAARFRLERGMHPRTVAGNGSSCTYMCDTEHARLAGMDVTALPRQRISSSEKHKRFPN